MGQPSFAASNTIIYLTYGAFLVLGSGVAWRLKTQAKGGFLAGNRTQTAIPLALNFIASGLGSSILFSYPELATLTGLQGVLVYGFASACPLFIFASLGPVIRRKCPEGFVLTEWTRQRYGIVAALFLSFVTLVTLFLYMISELSAIGQVVTALTGLDGLPVMIVECVVTTFYTSIGGFSISFITDNVQAFMVLCLVVLSAIAIGSSAKIDASLVRSTHLLDSSLLGWQLLYMLPVAILTNDFFLSNFWLRTFASKTDRDLVVGVSLAALCILLILVLVGLTGLVAIWSGVLDPADVDESSSVAFFLLLEQLPPWIVGIVLVMAVSLSTSALDSLQSAMVSSASNDLLRNCLNIWSVRLLVVLVIVPAIVIALRAPSILQIYLISDLVSAATIPVLVVGLSDKCYWWRGFDVVVGALGGLLTVFLFGTVYYGDVYKGAQLLLLKEGLYVEDWAAFGAFVAAPVGGLVWGFLAMAGRLAVLYILARKERKRFDALDRPTPSLMAEEDEPVEVVTIQNTKAKEPGKFFF